MPVPSLYNLAQDALQKAFILRCEALLRDVEQVNSVPTPVEHNGDIMHVCKKQRLIM